MTKQRDIASCELIERVGPDLVADHFGISRQHLHMWKVRGIPQMRRLAFQNLANQHGVTVPADFLAELYGVRTGKAA
jgi:hypothetical protein